MEKLIRIGMDTSKQVFQLHGVNAAEEPILRRKLRRKEMVAFFQRLEPTVVGIEACGGAHHWARVLQGFGHQVKLLPPKYAKAYVKRGKNDAADAEALCEAMSRPTMRFVAAKTAEQQAGADAGRHARPADPPAHPADQCDSRLCGGVWADRGARRRQDRTVAGAPVSRADAARIGTRAVC
jgi:transposase